MNVNELKEILKKHTMWLMNEEGGARANLRGADLRCADLEGANLRCVDLRCVDLEGANLRGANLRGADLRCADLEGANLRGVDLRGADLEGANFEGANLEDTIGLPPLACPGEGSYIGFKKAHGHIVVLQIAENAKRSSATTRKCRASEVKALRIENLDGTTSDKTRITSDYDPLFVYTVGETVEVKNFDDNRWNECAPGIHHFITRQEAVDY